MIFFLSSRYAFSKTAHHRASAMRIMITTSLSLAMVVVILSVMDFLQSTRFNEIRNVRSFDIVVEGRHSEELKELYPDLAIFEYGDGEALIGGNAFFVRYVDSDYAGGIRMLAGNMDSLAIPYTLYRIDNSKAYNVSLLKRGRSGIVLPKSQIMDISGIYTSSLGLEFDSSMVFLPISFADDSANYKTAIKGIDINEKIHLEKLGYSVTTWKEAESGLYSAFLVEKVMMYVVLALLFLIIGISTKQSVRIFYREKRRERAELEILGLKRESIGLSFMLSFLLVLLLALVFALILSLILLPIIEIAGGRYISFNIKLYFPIGAFLVFSSFMVILTLFFALREGKKDKSFDLVEVINEG